MAEPRSMGTPYVTLPAGREDMSQAEILSALDDNEFALATRDPRFSPAIIDLEARRRGTPRVAAGNPRGSSRTPTGARTPMPLPGVVAGNVLDIARRRRDDTASAAKSADAALSGLGGALTDWGGDMKASFPAVQNPARGIMARVGAPNPAVEAQPSPDEMTAPAPQGGAMLDYVKSLFSKPAAAPASLAEVAEGGLPEFAIPEGGQERGPTDMPAPEMEAPQGIGASDLALYRDAPGANDPLMQAIAAAGGARQQTPPPAAGAMAPPPAALNRPSGGAVPGVSAPAAVPAPATPDTAAAVAAQAVAEAGGTPEQQQVAAQSAYEKASQAARERVQAILAKQEGAGISDRDKWLSLALGGARMAASRNPTFFGALGEGAEAGLQNFSAQDKLAKEQARAKTGQELQAEQLAETAGDRAERRFNQAQETQFRQMDRKDRNYARAQELDFRYKELRQRAEDNRLTREERAEARREANEARLEIAKLYAGSREAIASGNQAAALQRAEIRAARAAGADPARIREAEILVTKGTAPDFNTAYDMVRSGVNDLTTYQRNVQSAKVDLRKGLTDITGKLTVTEDELEDRARQLVRDRAGSGPRAGAAAPAAAPAPAAGGWSARPLP